MIIYSVYKKTQDVVDPQKDDPTFHSEKFTSARHYILTECKDQNVVMTEEDVKDGEILSFSFVPVLAYTIV